MYPEQHQLNVPQQKNPDIKQKMLAADKEWITSMADQPKYTTKWALQAKAGHEAKKNSRPDNLPKRCMTPPIVEEREIQFWPITLK